MGIRLQAELRKINGVRFARFTVLDNVETDSKEEVAIRSAMRECNIEAGDFAGIFTARADASDEHAPSRVAGVDIPVNAIHPFTTAMTNQGFEVTWWQQ